MAEITVARALTRLKIIQNRINDLIKEVSVAIPAHSRACSLITSEKDISRNHKKAREIISSHLSGIRDLQKYYVILNTEILKSNLEARIKSDRWGEMTVAQALSYCTAFSNQFKTLDDYVRRAAASADTLANNYNRMLFPNGTSIPQEELQALLAQPVLLIDEAEIQRIKADREVVLTELNDLINQSNAVTTITLPEGTPEFI